MPIAVVAPQKLRVGEMNDLVVSVGQNGGIGEIGFTVQVDPNVLQVRAGTEGDWAAGAGLDVRFAADIADAEDRVRIRAAVSGPKAGAVRGSVAIVQFQAMAPGTTSVLISDVTVKNPAGKPIAFRVAAANLQITVE